MRHVTATAAALGMLLLSVTLATGESFREKLEKAVKVTDESLKTIHKRWDIDHYPKFLRTVAMSHTSWEVLKVSI
jgi:hypothetical protein